MQSRPLLPRVFRLLRISYPFWLALVHSFFHTQCLLVLCVFVCFLTVFASTLVLLMWPSTNQTPQNRSHDRTLNRLMHTLVWIIWIMHTFQRPTAVSGKW